MATEEEVDSEELQDEASDADEDSLPNDRDDSEGSFHAGPEPEIVCIGSLMRSFLGLLSPVSRYTWLALGTLLFFLGFYIRMALNEERFLVARISQCCVVVAAMFGLLPFMLHEPSDQLEPATRLLENYAKSRNFYVPWLESSARHLCVLCLLWMIALLMQMAVAFVFGLGAAFGFEWEFRVQVLSSMAAMALTGGALTLLNFAQAYFLCFFAVMIDHFCIKLAAGCEYERAATEWNISSALLRKGSRTIDSCFLSMQISLGISFAGLCAQVFASPSEDRLAALSLLGAYLPILAQMLCVLFTASSVTSKCFETPVVVNSIVTSGNLSCVERQRLIEFIRHCRAGFYVQGMQVEPDIALKVSALVLILCFLCVNAFA